MAREKPSCDLVGNGGIKSKANACNVLNVSTAITEPRRIRSRSVRRFFPTRWFVAFAVAARTVAYARLFHPGILFIELPDLTRQVVRL